MHQDGQYVAGTLFQHNHTVKRDIWQHIQTTDGSLYQEKQRVQGSLYQNSHIVKDDIIEYTDKKVMTIDEIEKSLGHKIIIKGGDE